MGDYGSGVGIGNAIVNRKTALRMLKSGKKYSPEDVAYLKEVIRSAEAYLKEMKFPKKQWEEFSKAFHP